MSEHPYREAPRGDAAPDDVLTVLAFLTLGAAWMLLADVVLCVGCTFGLVTLSEWMPGTWWLVPALGLPLLWIRSQGGFRRTRRPRSEPTVPASGPDNLWESMGLTMQISIPILCVATIFGHEVGVPWATERVLEHPWMLLPLVLFVVPSGLALRRWSRRLSPRTE